MFFSLIVIIHELGHVLAALYFKWNIDKVILLPFGALTLFKEKINKPLFEEFIILIMGPLFQVVFTFLFFRDNSSALGYSNMILFFNLLPIFPLDGSKLLNIILNKFIGFKRSHLITIYVSILVIFFILLRLKFNFILILILFFILIKVFEEIRNHNNLFNRFLLERYLYDFHFKRRKVVSNVFMMKRDYKHIFYSGKGYITEKEILRKKFDFNKKM